VIRSKEFEKNPGNDGARDPIRKVWDRNNIDNYRLGRTESN
jgi:hypothetical protein